ncbi:hypothetical protein [Staphylococcus haemolyticus]|uniref:hypothetical protein n=1 Tax=Staphylococcus haemolyticus TaxID=1283 RepID=UPI001F0A0D6C|nr:hypothetical protein [Staphylococcus haemolyticus]MCH4328293.1 hypothetical protein [Staphylococcus haemolyticus]
MKNISGNRYIYHYHIFESSTNTFDSKSLNLIPEVLPIIAISDFNSQRKNNYGFITKNHDYLEKEGFYQEIMKYVGRGYLESERNYYNYVAMDSYSDYKSYFLAPIVFEKNNETIYIYLTLKIFSQGIFYIEVTDELDKLNFTDDNFNIIENGEDCRILFPIMENKNIKYIERDIEEGIINTFVDEYHKFIFKTMENIYQKKTVHTYFTLFILDDGILNGKNNIDKSKEIAAAPYFKNLGTHFSNSVKSFDFNHFKFFGNINRIVVNLKSGGKDYTISKKTYKEDKYYYRGINNAFIMSALNYIYIKKSILNFLAETTYNNNPINREWLNFLEKNIIQGYSLKYVPSHDLRKMIDEQFIDSKEFETIQRLHYDNANIQLSKKQEVVETKINLLNLIVFIFTILSIAQIVEIFTDNKKIIAIITSAIFLITIAIIFFVNYIYTKKKRNNIDH